MKITRWDNLPDPCTWAADGPGGNCTVHGLEGNWKHLVNKHVRNSAEPWEQWVTAAILGDIEQVSAASVAAECWGGAIRRLAAAMNDAVHKAFRRPLVVLVRERRRPTAPAVRKWILVLPVGAQMLVACDAKAGNLLLTCFFPEEVRDEEPEDRWRALAEKIVRQYCHYVPGGERRHPLQSKVFAKQVAGRFHDSVQFVTLASWGFGAVDNCWSAEIEDWSPRVDACNVRPALVTRRQEVESEASHVCE
jgi:hypothetical protein